MYFNTNVVGTLYYQYGRRTVHLDGCVEVASAYYSAPPGWIGRRVDVQWNDAHVRLLDPSTGQLLREHLRAPRGWHRIADPDRPARTPPTSRAGQLRVRVRASKTNADGRREDLRLLAGPFARAVERLRTAEEPAAAERVVPLGPHQVNRRVQVLAAALGLEGVSSHSGRRKVATVVGEAGHVFATELSPRRRDDIRKSVAVAGLGNVSVVEAGEHQTNLAPGCCEAISSCAASTTT